MTANMTLAKPSTFLATFCPLKMSNRPRAILSAIDQSKCFPVHFSDKR